MNKVLINEKITAVKNWKDNIYFVLVEPKEPGNIGASARAIKNMGFSKLCLVNPLRKMGQATVKVLLEDSEARWFAKGAFELLKKASIFHTFHEAISDKTLVVGTTRRTGKRRGVIFPLEEGIKRILPVASDNKVAIVFGREDRGLLNEEVRECGFLMTIATSTKAPSLNLAQAVMIVAYELSKMGRSTDAIEIPSITLVTHAQIDLLLERINETLRALGYIPRGDRDLEKKIMDNMGFLLRRAGLTEWELNMLHGICTRLLQHNSEAGKEYIAEVAQEIS